MTSPGKDFSGRGFSNLSLNLVNLFSKAKRSNISLFVKPFDSIKKYHLDKRLNQVVQFIYPVAFANCEVKVSQGKAGVETGLPKGFVFRLFWSLQ